MNNETKEENTIYYKITNKDECHRGYQYNDGLNILDRPFEKEGTCVHGGLYFTNKENIHYFFGYGEWLRVITIPKDAQMVQDPDTSNGIKFRADKIILGPFI